MSIGGAHHTYLKGEMCVSGQRGILSPDRRSLADEMRGRAGWFVGSW